MKTLFFLYVNREENFYPSAPRDTGHIPWLAHQFCAYSTSVIVVHCFQMVKHADNIFCNIDSEQEDWLIILIDIW